MRPMPLVPNTIAAPVGRIGAAAQNALEVARFGGLTTDDEPAPYEVTTEQRVFRLRRYYPPGGTASDETAPDGTASDETAPAPQMLLVPPLMLAAEIYDVSPTTSAVSLLHEHGVDPCGQLVGVRDPVGDPGGRDLLLRPRDPRGHRRLGHEERPRHLCGRQPADEPQRQRDLRLP